MAARKKKRSASLAMALGSPPAPIPFMAIWWCTTEAIEFVKPCGKMVENRRDDKILIPYEDTTFPPGVWTVSRRCFHRLDEGGGRRPGSALAARLDHCPARDVSQPIHHPRQDKLGRNNVAIA